MTLALPILLAAGCSSPDASFVQHAASEQAKQNHAMADLSKTVSEDHWRVIETVEKSRQAVVELEKDLQVQRGQLEEERKSMSQERKSLADERHRESLLAPVINSLGLLLVAAAPLALAAYLLHGLRNHNDDEAVSEVLIHELAASESPLLPSPGRHEAIGHEADPSTQTETTETPPF
jgi:hypothetical protein